MFESLFTKLNDAEVIWCFLREPQIIKQDMQDGDDIDIWCSRKSLHNLLNVVTDEKWFVSGGRTVKRKFSNDTSITLRFKHPKLNNVLEVWVSVLRARHVFLATETEILKSIINCGEFNYLSLSYQLLMVTARPIILRKQLLKYNGRASRLINQLDHDELEHWKQKMHEIFPDNYAESIISSYVLSENNKKSLLLNLLTDCTHLTLENVFSYLKVKVKYYCHSMRLTRGMLVSFIGVDGAGKTTLINALYKRLESQYGPSYIYMGRSRNNSAIVNVIRNIILNRRVVSKTIIDKRNCVPSYKSPWLLSASKFCAVLVYFIEYWSRYMWLRIKARISGNYYLIDRGSMDLCLMDNLGRLPEFVGNILPREDAVVFCWADSKTIRARKTERSIHEINRQNNILKRLINGASLPTILSINTGNPVDFCLKNILILFAVISAVRHGFLDDASAKVIVSLISEPYI